MGSRLAESQPQPPPSDGVVEAVLDLWREGQKAHEIPIRGRSMFPALRDGDIVRVVHEVGNWGPGVIVVFRQGRELIAHRVLRARQAGHGGRTYLTQGDRCPYPDRPLEAGEILGRVVGVWRNGRYRAVGGWRQRWLGWIIAQGLQVKTRLHQGKWIRGLRKPDDAS